MKNFVIIPYRDKPGLTIPLVKELVFQRGVDKIILLDNESTEDTKNAIFDELGYSVVSVLEVPGKNIHKLWNAGLGRAAELANGELYNVLILNNDVQLQSSDFVEKLARGLRSSPEVGAACPNYDDRPGSWIQYVEDLPMHTGWYNQTEGLCGWAFMIRGEDDHRFPEELHWWFGDNDLLQTIRAQGRRVVLCQQAACRHLNSQTLNVGEEPFKSLVERDRKLFEEKWGKI